MEELWFRSCSCEVAQQSSWGSPVELRWVVSSFATEYCEDSLSCKDFSRKTGGAKFTSWSQLCGELREALRLKAVTGAPQSWACGLHPTLGACVPLSGILGSAREVCSLPACSDPAVSPADLVNRILANAAESKRFVGDPDDSAFRIEDAWAVAISRSWWSPLDELSVRSTWAVEVRPFSSIVATEAFSSLVKDDMKVVRLGEGCGFKYLALGSKVYTSDSIELNEPLRGRLSTACTGTSRIFTRWPGRKGQHVVEGSTESWYSASPSSRYYHRHVLVTVESRAAVVLQSTSTFHPSWDHRLSSRTYR